MNRYRSAMLASCGAMTPTSLMELARLSAPPMSRGWKIGRLAGGALAVGGEG